MCDEEDDPLAEFKLVTAKFVLGLAQSGDVPPAADRALSNGVYSDALAELSQLGDATRFEVEPLLKRAFTELNRKAITKADAAWALARHCVGRVALGNEHPLAALKLLRDVVWASADVVPDPKHIGEGLDLGLLIGISWHYTEPDENFYKPQSSAR